MSIDKCQRKTIKKAPPCASHEGAPVSYTHLDVYKRQEQISEYSFCLKAAHAALQSAGGGPFLFAVDTLPRMLINAVPPERLHHYFADCAQLLNHHADWLSTLDALVQSNMDLAAAAAGLYLHKNSLIFRLKHMLRELRLDSLQSDQTKYFLILLYHYCQHFAQEPDAP